MTELAALMAASGSWPILPTICISTLEINTLPSGLPQTLRRYVIGECNRHQPWQAVKTAYRSVQVVLKERPDVVISTGSFPLALFCIVSRLLGSKIVWIDSISQIDGLSMSGRLIRPFADLFFVQWPELENSYPGTRYEGELV